MEIDLEIFLYKFDLIMMNGAKLNPFLNRRNSQDL